MQETTRSMFLSILLTQDFTKLVRAQTRLQLGSISHHVDFLFLSHIVHPELFSPPPGSISNASVDFFPCPQWFRERWGR